MCIRDSYCCAPPILPPDGPLSENASSPPISPTEPSTDQRVELRPYDAIDAPELQGRTHAFGSELASCDIWALAVLLNWLLTGKPMTAPPASASPIDGISGTQAGDRSPVASRSTQTEYAGDTLESIAVGPHHPLPASRTPTGGAARRAPPPRMISAVAMAATHRRAAAMRTRHRAAVGAPRSTRTRDRRRPAAPAAASVRRRHRPGRPRESASARQSAGPPLLRSRRARRRPTAGRAVSGSSST